MAWAAALAALMLANVAPASARTAARRTARSVAAEHPELGPPLGRPKPAHVAAPFAATTTTAPSPWQHVTAPPFSPGTMLLASDGTVLVHSEPESGGTPDWYRLTPNAKGSYAGGTWTKIASMPSSYAPLYFASAILPDGRMIVEGGEYNGGTPVWQNRGEIYNPVTNTWQQVQPPPGWTSIGDAESDVLDNGTFVLAQPCQSCASPSGTLSKADALLNAENLTWTTFGGQGKNDPNDEEGWTLEPNGNILTVDTWLPPDTEQFNPATFTWSTAGNTIKSPINGPSVEIGPQVEMPGGNTLVVGAGTGPEAPAACNVHTPAVTQVYRYAQGRWANGPSIPTIGGEQYASADGPGSVLPDGNVLFDVSPCVYNTPLAFELYNATSNTLSPVTNVPTAADDSSYNTRLLALPNGQVLFDDGTSRMEVYTAGGTPQASWAPSITALSSTSLAPGGTYSLSGTQLAGLDQGAAYGDDAQDNTNFPLVRIRNNATGVITYARTTNWSSVSVAPGTSSSTDFTVPSTTPAGASTLVVVANGIPSAPQAVTIP